MNRCLTCGKECEKVYCNQECYSNSPKLKEQAKNSKLMELSKGNTWRKNKKHSKKSIKKIKENTPKKIGEKNHNWKGDDVGYDALHDWIKSHKEFTGKCKICGLESQNRRIIQIANISGEYKRDVNDFAWLCNKCHLRFDALKNFQSYEVIGVECKSNSYLTKEEKAKCKWYLDNNVFGKILIASRGEKRGEIKYKEFENET